MSLLSGFTATENDNINCDDAESDGKNIPAGLENAKIRRKDQVKILGFLHPGMIYRTTH